jgi:hypothetical protein
MLESTNKSATASESASMTDTDEPNANMFLSASATNTPGASQDTIMSAPTTNTPVSHSNAIAPSLLPKMPTSLDTIASASTTNTPISHGDTIAPSSSSNVPTSGSLDTTTYVPSTNPVGSTPPPTYARHLHCVVSIHRQPRFLLTPVLGKFRCDPALHVLDST